MSGDSARQLLVPYCWIGLDDPLRIDTASIRMGADSMTGHGTSTTSDYAVAWSLDVAPGWITRRLTVSVVGDGWTRSLELVRAPDGEWTAHTTRSAGGPTHQPGLADFLSLDGAVDCDLGLCPVTNTMPLRRLHLQTAEVAPTPLVMAWVEVPSLQVSRNDQIYSSRSGTITYRSAAGDFTADLQTDEHGVVTHYPGLATRRAVF